MESNNGLERERLDSNVRVLLVEDEPEMAGFIARGLRAESYAVDIASDGSEALYQAEINDYDIVLLDVRLPVKDGLTVCRELRERSFRSPILMLTALDSNNDVVNGLDSGADDYLPKPFDFRVLLARIRALLRRADEIRPNVIQVADLTLNTLDHTAVRADRSIRLTAKEYALLELFTLHAGQILGRAQIAEHVWDENFDPFSNIIDVYVKRLRKKIDSGFDRPLLHTRRGEGYMLSADPLDSSYV
jgi:two-component system copper resistance phosphate regulon response regulator CusR